VITFKQLGKQQMRHKRRNSGLEKGVQNLCEFKKTLIWLWTAVNTSIKEDFSLGTLKKGVLKRKTFQPLWLVS